MPTTLDMDCEHYSRLDRWIDDSATVTDILPWLQPPRELEPVHISQRVGSTLEAKFEDLVGQWRAETAHLSSIQDKVLHRAYQEIIALGSDAVPLILRELKRSGGHWFWALRVLTGANPVKPEHAGHVREMKETWLDWGRRAGYI